MSSAQDGEIDPNGYNTFYYPNGKPSSEGNMVNGKPEGYWKTYYDTGILKSEGNRKNFLLDSIWKFYSPEGVLQQEISYVADHKTGVTKNFSVEGFKLSEEEMVNDQIHGEVRFYHPEGPIKKVVPYLEDRRDGIGYEYGKQGTIITITHYQHNFVKRREEINRRDRKGRKTGMWKTWYDNDQLSVEGSFLEGEKNGYWKEYDRKGILLSTTKWQNGQVVENANEVINLEIRKEYYPDASIRVIASYRDGTPEGVTREYDKEGNIVHSKLYKDGLLTGEGLLDEEGIKQGPWKEYYTTGELRGEGAYTAGQKTGAWVFYFRSGKVEQKGKYISGERPHGLWTWWYETGDVRREENFHRGIEDGPMVEYSDSGTVLTQGEFLEGLEEGEWILDVGDHKEEGKFIGGERDGLWVYTFKETEKLNFKGNFVQGIPEGKHTWYFDTGQKMLEGKYVAGLKEGDWKRYNEDGTVHIEILYQDGKEKRVNGVKVKDYQPTRKLQRKAEKANKREEANAGS